MTQASPIKILLIEDDQGDIELTTESLKRSKLMTDLVSIKDGEKALDYLHKKGEYSDAERPDLILLDLNLPKVDGREILKRVKGDKDLDQIPVIILTTSEEEGDVLASYDNGANCYIAKPVDFHKFSEIIQEMQHFWFQIVKLPQ